jgi:tripartite ATP-independent transporter DctM subunit
LFVAGILPGCLIGLGLMAIAAWNAHRHNYPREREVRASAKEVLAAFKKGIWPIGAPLLLIGGMVGGIFTPTEASLVTVGYTLILVLFIYRTIRVGDLPAMLRATAAQASIPLFCLACATVYGYLLALYKVPDSIGQGILQITDNPQLIMLLVIGLFLAIGTFMDGVPAIIILLPITRKLAEVAEINPLHMGAVVCVTIALGLLTPPYGLCTLITCSIGNIEIKQAFRPMLPMFALMLGVVLIMGLFPDVALLLPRLLVPDLVPPR